MSHIHPNNSNNQHHVFRCDTCQRIAGINRDEGAALREARETARRDGWKWNHPGWGMTCPYCKTEAQS